MKSEHIIIVLLSAMLGMLLLLGAQSHVWTGSATSDIYATGHVADTDLTNIANNLLALKSNFSGDVAPSSPEEGQWWVDTTSGSETLKFYLGTGWMNLFDYSNGTPVINIGDDSIDDANMIHNDVRKPSLVFNQDINVNSLSVDGDALSATPTEINEVTDGAVGAMKLVSITTSTDAAYITATGITHGSWRIVYQITEFTDHSVNSLILKWDAENDANTHWPQIGFNNATENADLTPYGYTNIYLATYSATTIAGEPYSAYGTIDFHIPDTTYSETLFYNGYGGVIVEDMNPPSDGTATYISVLRGKFIDDDNDPVDRVRIEPLSGLITGKIYLFHYE